MMRRHDKWSRFVGRQCSSLVWIVGLGALGLSGCHSLSVKGGTAPQLAGSVSTAPAVGPRSNPAGVGAPAVGLDRLAALPPVPILTPEDVLKQRSRESSQGIRLVTAMFPLVGESSPKPTISTSIGDSPVIEPVVHRVDWSGVLAAARELEAKDKWSEAIQSYQAFLDQPEIPAAVYHRLGVLYDKTGQAALAVPMYKRALELDPNNADLLCDLGYRRQMMGDGLTAQQYYQKALSIDSQHARSHNHLAVMLLNDGGAEDLVMEHFRKAGLSWFQAKQNIRYLKASRPGE